MFKSRVGSPTSTSSYLKISAHLKGALICLVMHNDILFLHMAKNVCFLELENIAIDLLLMLIDGYLRIMITTDFL